jgi:hypothetical protein
MGLDIILLPQGELEDFLSGDPCLRIYSKHAVNQKGYVGRIEIGEFWINSLGDLSIKSSHVLGLEWWLHGAELIEDTPHRPDVTLAVVRLVLPHLGAAVVGSSSLGFHYSQLCYFTNIKVSQLHLARLGQKNVGTLDISVDNLLFAKGH